MLLLNAFSGNMLASLPATVEFEPLDEVEATNVLLAAGLDSAVGHADTAAVFSSVLGVTVPAERRTISLEKGDEAVLGQYRGPRLEEGAIELPEGAVIQWMRVRVH